MLLFIIGNNNIFFLKFLKFFFDTKPQGFHLIKNISFVASSINLNNLK